MRHCFLRGLLVACAVGCLVALPARGQTDGAFPPVDEATEDPSFFRFRARLMEAVVQHDAAFLLAHVPEEGMAAFDGRMTRERLIDEWKPHRVDSPLWALLGHLLAHGGAFVETGGETGGGGRVFEAPYYSAVWDSDAYDPFAHVAVIGSTVPVRAAADSSSAVVDTIGYTIRKMPGVPPDARCSRPVRPLARQRSRWQPVVQPSGDTGYVSCENVGRPIGYRVGFRKTDDGWMLAWLVAGD